MLLFFSKLVIYIDAQLFFIKPFSYYFCLFVRCSPCKGFTPGLVEFYKKSRDEKNFEVIFVSMDKSEEDFKKYYAEMPWLALSFEAKQIKVYLHLYS
jgi:hypothetical protein